MLYILIPTTKERRQQLAECIANIEANADIPHCIITDENEDGGWVKAIHRFCTRFDEVVWVIGTDVRINKTTLSTLKNAYDNAFPNHDGIAQPFDEFHNGALAVHPMAHTKTLQKYLYHGYTHCFSDNEMTERVVEDGKYLYVPEAFTEHLHCFNKKAQEDETYKTIYGENMHKDRELYLSRKENRLRQGIVITTTEATKPFFIDLITSLKDVSYPIMIVGNDGYSGAGVDIVNDWNGFELGGIKRGAEYFDEFVYLQDTVVVKDIAIFDKVFKDYKGQSVAISKDFYSYIGKYVSKDCGDVPVIDNKRDAVFHEISGYRPHYIQRTKPVALDSVLPIESDVFEDRHGRKNMVLESEYMVKYKGTWSMEQII